ncbi:MAG: nucleotide sugar dehydrogenase [Solirubrobacteraceae bacterium]
MPTIAAPNSDPIAVVGLWHLGTVTAACLADVGREVRGVDPDEATVQALRGGAPPVAEPGLAELLQRNASRLSFDSAPSSLTGLRQAWLTFDTPVDDDDVADVEWVLNEAERLLEPLAENALVVISAQLPAGSTVLLQERCEARRGGTPLRFACIPENLRLGSALESLQSPDRFVAGVRNAADQAEVAALLAPFSAPIEWMTVESAEMTKHALNGFLATSVAYINEVAAICEAVGADALEVSRGLRSERRIGPRAYLGPGDAFAGGTLARDLGFMRELAAGNGLPGDVLGGVARGNAAHSGWALRTVQRLVGRLDGRKVALWGLTYKPSTSTLRRSGAVELACALCAEGAKVAAHDPAVAELPAELEGSLSLSATPLEALRGASALVLCTPWPEYRDVPTERLVEVLAGAPVIDAAGFLAGKLQEHRGVVYVRVGAPRQGADR